MGFVGRKQLTVLQIFSGCLDLVLPDVEWLAGYKNFNKGRGNSEVKHYKPR